MEPGRYNVLIVEHEKDLRESLSKELSKGGYKVLAVSDIDEVPDAFSNREWDYVVLDYSLPGGRGMEIAEGIREWNPEIPISLLYDDKFSHEFLKQSLESGIRDLFAKKFGPKDIALKIDLSFRRNNSVKSERTRCEAHSALLPKNLMPMYLSPLKAKDYREYNLFNRTFNIRFQKNVRAYLTDCIGCAGKTALATTGSDGRFEKGLGSKMELVILAESETNVDEVSELARFYIRQLANRKIFELVNVKYLDRGVISYHEDHPNLVFPQRIIDLSYLCGDAHKIWSAKKKLEWELQQEGIGRRIFEQLKARKKEHMRIMRQGRQKYKGDEIKHYDLESGEMFYDPGRNIASFKYGPLRAIQFAQMATISKLVRKWKTYDFLEGLPNNTSERYIYLMVSGNLNLNPSEINDLTDSYNFFLYQYHLAQWRHRLYRAKKTDISKDTPEIKERIRSIDDLLKKEVR